MAGNQNTRVREPLAITTGPLPGQMLLESFRQALAAERVFQIMFGENAEHVYVGSRPSINETILPAMILGWKQETYRSNNVYLEGTIDCLIVLPTRLEGDYNAQRSVASMLQRWMGGTMNLFPQNPGLIRFGYESEFSYADEVIMDGQTAPMISATFPFKFDLQLMRLQADGFDPNRPLDASDVGYLESLHLTVKNEENNSILTEVVVETDQTNPKLPPA